MVTAATTQAQVVDWKSITTTLLVIIPGCLFPSVVSVDIMLIWHVSS